MNSFNKILICCLLFWGQATAQSDKASWYGNDHFKISQEGAQVKISMEKLPWESFSAELDEIMPAGGMLTFEVNAEKSIQLRVDGFAAGFPQSTLFSERIKPGSFKKFFLRLEESEPQLEQLIFYINPGETYKGTIYLRNLKVSAILPKEAEYSVHPNPASGIITITLPSVDISKIMIYDSAGRQVYVARPSGGQHIVNVSKYTPGVYTVRAKAPDRYLTTKVIVQ